MKLIIPKKLIADPAKLTRALAQAETKILTLETGKDQLERQARQPQPQPQQQQGVLWRACGQHQPPAHVAGT